MYSLSFIFYKYINLGLNFCASACPEKSFFDILNRFLILISILEIIIFFRPLKNKNTNKFLKVMGMVLKTLIVLYILFILYNLLIRYIFPYEEICTQDCVVEIIPHPLSKWAFLLGNISLLFLIYFFFKELQYSKSQN